LVLFLWLQRHHPGRPVLHLVRETAGKAPSLPGGQQDGLNSLGLVASLTALANPNLLWDAGFQLSFMATLGLVL
jgi:hypothetical protein